jgi:vacuolar-type H+-ATPase subunit I/STV1
MEVISEMRSGKTLDAYEKIIKELEEQIRNQKEIIKKQSEVIIPKNIEQHNEIVDSNVRIKELEDTVQKQNAQLELLSLYEYQRNLYRKRCNKIVNYITDEIEDDEFVETAHYTEILDSAKGGRDDKSTKE